MASGVFAQKTLTWEDAKREFEAANPTLRAGRIGIQESRADEVTFGLRHATERFEPAAALQVETSATSGAGARNNFVFVPAWRGVLLDFLQAQQDYRSIQLSYLDLVESYLNAASQMNLAVGTGGHPMKRIILVGGAFAIALSVLLSGCDQKVTVNPRLELLYSSLRFNLVWFLHSDSLFLGKRKFALSLSRPGAGSRCFLRSTGHSREFADIRLNAHPNIGLKGRVSNIGSILDPNIRTAKVRIEIENPGLMRLGMFVQATFHGQQKQARAVVPASAILHLDDRDWVYVPKGGNTFRRVEVLSGQMVPPDRQEILSGIRAGDRVVTHALLMQHSSEQ